MGLAAAGWTAKIRERAPKRGHQSNLMSELPEPLDGDPSTVYFPGACYQLYPVVLPCFPDGDQHCLQDDHSRQRQRTEGVVALSLANRIRLPSTPSLSITLSDGLCGGIREHHVWIAHSSPPAPKKTVIAKFYDPIYQVCVC